MACVKPSSRCSVRVAVVAVVCGLEEEDERVEEAVGGAFRQVPRRAGVSRRRWRCDRLASTARYIVRSTTMGTLFVDSTMAATGPSAMVSFTRMRLRLVAATLYVVSTGVPPVWRKSFTRTVAASAPGLATRMSSWKNGPVAPSARYQRVCGVCAAAATGYTASAAASATSAPERRIRGIWVLSSCERNRRTAVVSGDMDGCGATGRNDPYSLSADRAVAIASPRSRRRAPAPPPFFGLRTCRSCGSRPAHGTHQRPLLCRSSPESTPRRSRGRAAIRPR